MEVSFTQDKWPCPYKNEFLKGLNLKERQIIDKFVVGKSTLTKHSTLEWKILMHF